MRRIPWSIARMSGVAAFVLAAGMESSNVPAFAQEGRPRQSEGGEASAMFRRLDANGDGRLNKSEARPNERTLFDNIFRMAGKSDSESISSAEFQRVFDQHRSNQGGPGNRPPGGRPPGDEPGNTGRPNERRPTESRSSEDRPNDRRPNDRRPPREGDRAGTGTRERTAGNPVEGSGGSAERKPGAGANRLTGLWRGWVVDGRGQNPNTGHLQMELRIENNRITAREIGQRGNREGLGDGTFVVAADGTSGDLDATGTSGRHDGVEYLGIFEVNGDTLKWCVGNRGKPRPSEYSTGRGNYYMILRRVDESKTSS